ncbi:MULTISPECIES: zf-HC2 domain-containing protein [Actinomadura]|uniref:Zf-HC2 domain-containing protein n=1 Tax=Actinomadura yumaensis TaxID=111807 RepID=A0ABW2CYS5_9ACTN|nr:zf-HC2 domain-containing protein [Actinomadura sp. J1-007]
MEECQHRLGLGVYALGRLRGPEAADLRAHLSACAPCRAELAEFQGVTAVLARTRRGAGRASRTGASVHVLSGGACARAPER